MIVNAKDCDILRELGKQVKEVAMLPVQQETIRLWKASNDLKQVRPMVMIDDLPWHEMDIDGELKLKTEDIFCRGIEERLRRTLYSWKYMRADMVVEPYVDITKIFYGADFGISTIEQTAATDPNNGVLSHHYIDQLQTEEDIEKIRMPEIVYDEKATVKNEEMAHYIFDGILDIRMQGYIPGMWGYIPFFAPWDRIAEWRGVQNVLYDLVDRPDFLHKIMSRLTDAHLSMLDQLEAKGLLSYGQGIVHCSGAYTDELPAPGFDPQHTRAKDVWTFGAAQMFSTVSPAMHNEFELDYAKKWYSRFGLVSYGCCEPLHDKIDIIREIPNLRKISMSPWVDVEKGAERIGRDFVFTRKPNPALLAGTAWEPDAVERDLKDTMTKCKRHGCVVQFILKDVSTIKYEPQRLREWVDIAMRVVE